MGIAEHLGAAEAASGASLGLGSLLIFILHTLSASNT